MPADIPNGRLIFLNGTRQFKSVISYECETGHVLVGRSDLMCDVDQRWNGPPPRCEPVYCQEPAQIRYGGFSLSTNSTRFGTVVSYYCTSPRHELVGPRKITCLKDGSYNAEPPSCRQIGGQAEAGGVLPPLAAVPQKPRNRDPPRRHQTFLDKEGEGGVKRVRRPFVPRQKLGDFSPDRASLDRGQEIFSAR